MQQGEEFAEATGGAEVKGWRNGLLLILPAGGVWSDVIDQVHERLDEAKARSFWRGAQTTIDCGDRAIALDEMEALQHRIRSGFGLVPVAVIATDQETRANAEKLALTVYDELPAVRRAAPPAVLPVNHLSAHAAEAGAPEVPVAATPAASPPPVAASTTVNNALYVPQTVRSGQRIVHDGHLIVCGDVNAGSEVVAAGDILVFGVLRGVAHAGCYGDTGARIVASSLRPPQLRIANKIARAPEEPARGGGSKTAGAPVAATPEVARIANGEIQVFPL